MKKLECGYNFDTVRTVPTVSFGQQVFEEGVQFLIQTLHEALAQKGVVLIKQHELCHSLAVIVNQNE